MADIPRVPTLSGLFVLIVVVPLLLGPDHLWMPEWLRKRARPLTRGAPLRSSAGREWRSDSARS